MSSTFKGLVLSMSVLALAACSSDGASPPSPKTAAPMPPIQEMDMAMEKPAPQPLPLSQSDTVTPITAPAFAAPADPMTPAVTTTNPAAPVASVDNSIEARMAKLEQTVGSLQSDFNRIMPAFASLNTTNDRIQTLLDEIEKETGKRPAVADVQQKPVLKQTAANSPSTAAPAPGAVSKPPVQTAQKAPVAEAPKPAPQAASMDKTAETAAEVKPAAAPATTAGTMSSTVNGVRIGEHGTKTRLVFDLTTQSKPDFSYDLDNAEKLLLITLPASGWSGSETGKPSANSPLVQGWSVQKAAEGGSTLAVQLKKGARVLSTEYLKAEGKDGPRLVVDIAPNS